MYVFSDTIFYRYLSQILLWTLFQTPKYDSTATVENV